MWEVENRIISDKELLDFIHTKPHRLLIISGPTQSGKTTIIKNIKSDNKHIITSEGFADFGCMLGRCHTVPEINEILLTAYEIFDYLIIEDIDMSSRAYNLINKYVTDFIQKYVDRFTLIFTGVDIFRWGVFWDMYRKDKAIFVTYFEEENEIEKK